MFIKIYLHDLIIRICAYFSARLQGGYKQKVTVAPVALQVHTIVNVCMQKLWSKIRWTGSAASFCGRGPVAGGGGGSTFDDPVPNFKRHLFCVRKGYIVGDARLMISIVQRKCRKAPRLLRGQGLCWSDLPAAFGLYDTPQ